MESDTKAEKNDKDTNELFRKAWVENDYEAQQEYLKKVGYP